MSHIRRLSLPDGRMIAVRAIRPTDKRRLHAAFDRLSSESRYRRFLAPMERLSPALLRHLTEVDHHDHEALVALDDGGAIVGVARFVRCREDLDAAELAVTVADGWQSDGIGTALVALLTDRARTEGVHRFVGDMLWDNRRMHELLSEFGTPDLDPSHGVDEFSLALPDEPLGDRVPELLGSVARAAAVRSAR